jgi:hypothetical protein
MTGSGAQAAPLALHLACLCRGLALTVSPPAHHGDPLTHLALQVRHVGPALPAAAVAALREALASVAEATPLKAGTAEPSSLSPQDVTSPLQLLRRAAPLPAGGGELTAADSGEGPHAAPPLLFAAVSRRAARRLLTALQRLSAHLGGGVAVDACEGAEEDEAAIAAATAGSALAELLAGGPGGEEADRAAAECSSAAAEQPLPGVAHTLDAPAPEAPPLLAALFSGYGLQLAAAEAAGGPFDEGAAPALQFAPGAPAAAVVAALWSADVEGADAAALVAAHAVSLLRHADRGPLSLLDAQFAEDGLWYAASAQAGAVQAAAERTLSEAAEGGGRAGASDEGAVVVELCEFGLPTQVPLLLLRPRLQPGDLVLFAAASQAAALLEGAAPASVLASLPPELLAAAGTPGSVLALGTVLEEAAGPANGYRVARLPAALLGAAPDALTLPAAALIEVGPALLAAAALQAGGHEDAGGAAAAVRAPRVRALASAVLRCCLHPSTTAGVPSPPAPEPPSAAMAEPSQQQQQQLQKRRWRDVLSSPASAVAAGLLAAPQAGALPRSKAGGKKPPAASSADSGAPQPAAGPSAAGSSAAAAVASEPAPALETSVLDQLWRECLTLLAGLEASHAQRTPQGPFAAALPALRGLLRMMAALHQPAPAAAEGAEGWVPIGALPVADMAATADASTGAPAVSLLSAELSNAPGLLRGHRYEVRAAACNGQGCGPWSPPQPVEPPADEEDAAGAETGSDDDACIAARSPERPCGTQLLCAAAMAPALLQGMLRAHSHVAAALGRHGCAAAPLPDLGSPLCAADAAALRRLLPAWRPPPRVPEGVSAADVLLCLGARHGAGAAEAAPAGRVERASGRSLTCRVVLEVAALSAKASGAWAAPGASPLHADRSALLHSSAGGHAFTRVFDGAPDTAPLPVPASALAAATNPQAERGVGPSLAAPWRLLLAHHRVTGLRPGCAYLLRFAVGDAGAAAPAGSGGEAAEAASAGGWLGPWSEPVLLLAPPRAPAAPAAPSVSLQSLAQAEAALIAGAASDLGPAAARALLAACLAPYPGLLAAAQGALHAGVPVPPAAASLVASAAAHIAWQPPPAEADGDAGAGAAVDGVQLALPSRCLAAPASVDVAATAAAAAAADAAGYLPLALRVHRRGGGGSSESSSSLAGARGEEEGLPSSAAAARAAGGSLLVSACLPSERCTSSGGPSWLLEGAGAPAPDGFVVVHTGSAPAAAAAGASSLLLTALLPGVALSARVRLHNAAGWGPWSQPAEGSAPPADTPAAPPPPIVLPSAGDGAVRVGVAAPSASAAVGVAAPLLGFELQRLQVDALMPLLQDPEVAAAALAACGAAEASGEPAAVAAAVRAGLLAGERAAPSATLHAALSAALQAALDGEVAGTAALLPPAGPGTSLPPHLRHAELAALPVALSAAMAPAAYALAAAGEPLPPGGVPAVRFAKLKRGAAYAVRAAAVNEAGRGVFSPFAFFIAPGTLAAEAPAAVAAAAAAAAPLTRAVQLRCIPADLPAAPEASAAGFSLAADDPVRAASASAAGAAAAATASAATAEALQPGSAVAKKAIAPKPTKAAARHAQQAQQVPRGKGSAAARAGAGAGARAAALRKRGGPAAGAGDSSGEEAEDGEVEAEAARVEQRSAAAEEEVDVGGPDFTPVARGQVRTHLVALAREKRRLDRRKGLTARLLYAVGLDPDNRTHAAGLAVAVAVLGIALMAWVAALFLSNPQLPVPPAPPLQPAAGAPAAVPVFTPPPAPR